MHACLFDTTTQLTFARLLLAALILRIKYLRAIHNADDRNHDHYHFEANMIRRIIIFL